MAYAGLELIMSGQNVLKSERKILFDGQNLLFFIISLLIYVCKHRFRAYSIATDVLNAHAAISRVR